MKLITEEEAAAYEEATDGCRHSSVGTRNNARQWQRVKAGPGDQCSGGLGLREDAEVG
jgi:hypothetical protein